AYLAFSDAPLLDNTDLFIDENERVCLVGRNGAGKSTLLRVLAKEQPLDDGQVVYEQDLVTARLQQDPPRDIEGTIFDFVAQGVAEDAQYITEYHRV
ncbi:ATP-binding cassette domain-containing protein, partial [Escherichia coli]